MRSVDGHDLVELDRCFAVLGYERFHYFLSFLRGYSHPLISNNSVCPFTLLLNSVKLTQLVVAAQVLKVPFPAQLKTFLASNLNLLRELNSRLSRRQANALICLDGKFLVLVTYDDRQTDAVSPGHKLLLLSEYGLAPVCDTWSEKF